MKRNLRKKKEYKNIVILLSGGLDSSTLAYLVVKRSPPYLQNRVYSLTFDYGQNHKKELENAKKIAKKIGAVEHKILKFDLTLWGGSSLTDKKIKIPQNKKISEDDKGKLILKSIPNTYVPARNTIFLTFALAYAEAVKAEEIYIGVNSIDYSGYVDCRPAFIKKFQELAKIATVAGVQGKPIKIKAPLIDMTKGEIVKLGEKLSVPWDCTWSCYMGKKIACGVCDSCQLRLKGFVQAKVTDPLKYKTLPIFYKKSFDR